MKERIKELAEQAGINVIPRRPYIDEEPDGYLESDKDFLLNNYEVALKLLEGDALQKFSDLLLRECMTICGAIQGAAEYKNMQDFAAGAAKCKEIIKRDFGVE